MRKRKCPVVGKGTSWMGNLYHDEVLKCREVVIRKGVYVCQEQELHRNEEVIEKKTTEIQEICMLMERLQEILMSFRK